MGTGPLSLTTVREERSRTTDTDRNLPLPAAPTPSTTPALGVLKMTDHGSLLSPTAGGLSVLGIATKWEIKKPIPVSTRLTGMGFLRIPFLKGRCSL